MLFRLYSLRFSFRARDVIRFPLGQSANILRGAFGTIFRRFACVPPCVSPRQCQRRTTCPYARIFEPSAALRRGPSGLADWPRPYVFRATHLDGRTVQQGEVFYFDLNLFDLHYSSISCFVATFTQLAGEGLGPQRSRADLIAVSQLDAEGNAASTVFDDTLLASQENAPPLEISLDPPPRPVDRVRIRFLTATELKSDEQLAQQPDFSILAARVRDRISTLRELYGDGRLDIDFRAFGERAALVHMTRYTIQHVENTRRSSRTGQVHPIGGFIGEAEYEGDVTPFVPYLAAAKWTGVGRQTVWGKGQIAIECL